MSKQAAIKTMLLGGVAAFSMSPAFSQEAPGDEGNRDSIIVTGTRISDFEAPTPVTAISQVQLQRKAIVRVSELIDDIPALAANQNTGRSSAPVGASNFDLRSLGPARTLLLIDGRRVAASDPTGAFDTNLIPASLIERVEIVTGGASAAYGSDAVSGVVNITLDHDFVGVKGDVQYGVSTYDDVQAPAVSLAAGHAFADDRLHIVASFDYYDNEGQTNESTRPWGRRGYAQVTNTNPPPVRIASPDAVFSQLTDGGVSALRNIPALRGIQFGEGGEVLPFTYGESVGSTYMIGGDGGSLLGMANVYPEVARISGFSRATYELTDSIDIYADVLIAKTDIYSDGTTATNRGDIAIDIDNAFLPQEVRDIMVANSVDTFYMGRIGVEEGPFANTVDNKFKRYGLGAKGELGANWTWDAVVQHIQNDYYREDINNRNVRRYSLGVDAVIDPVTNDPICRSLLNNPGSTNPDIANCVPINVFGPGSVDQAALDYIGGAAVLDSEQTQTLVAVNLQGSPFSTWAGDVSVAVGGEWRKDEIDASSDPLSQQRGWITVNPQPLSGEVSVKEAYGEVVVPLMADQPMGYLLDVNGAVRVTDYSTSGTVMAWKAGMNYAPTPDIRFRGTYSRDIRAPSVNELFSGQNQSITNMIDPRDNSNPTVVALTGGNPSLDPELSNAWTAGVVLTPGWASGLRLSFDYYSFKIEDAIAALDAQTVIDNCFILMQTSLCDSISEGPTGMITQVQATLLNAASAKSHGFDVEFNYGVPVFNGAIDFRVLATHIGELSTTISGVKQDLVSQLGTESGGGVPEWRFVAGAQYSDDRFGAGFLVRYIDDGVNRVGYVDGVDIDENFIPSKTYVDVNLDYYVTQNIQVYGKINNLFNVEPALAPSPITSPSYHGGAYHDRIGRYFKIGARFQF